MLVHDLVLLGATLTRPDQALLATGVAVAALSELSRRELVQVTPGGVVRLLRREGTGEPILDDVLERLERMGPRSLGEVCDVIGRVVLAQADQELVEAGRLEVQERSLLAVRGRASRAALDDRRVETLRQRLVDVLTGEKGADPDTGPLLPMLHAMSWVYAVTRPALPAGWDRGQVERAGAGRGGTSWLAEPLRAHLAGQGGATAVIGGV